MATVVRSPRKEINVYFEKAPNQGIYIEKKVSFYEHSEVELEAKLIKALKERDNARHGNSFYSKQVAKLQKENDDLKKTNAELNAKLTALSANAGKESITRSDTIERLGIELSKCLARNKQLEKENKELKTSSVADAGKLNNQIAKLQKDNEDILRVLFHNDWNTIKGLGDITKWLRIGTDLQTLQWLSENRNIYYNFVWGNDPVNKSIADTIEEGMHLNHGELNSFNDIRKSLNDLIDKWDLETDYEKAKSKFKEIWNFFDSDKIKVYRGKFTTQNIKNKELMPLMRAFRQLLDWGDDADWNSDEEGE